MKYLLNKILNFFGYEIKRADNEVQPGSMKRKVGAMNLILEDLKARGLNCKSILDIGANETQWSRMAKKVFPSSHFYLIEPQSEMKESLEKFCQDFKNSKHFLNGAGAKNETLKLTIWDDLAGSSFLPEHNEGLKENNIQRDIEIITIDELISSSKIIIPELIKIDIQGYELEALKGAKKTFGHTEVYILEVSLFSFNMPGMPLFSDVINFMLEHDYVIYDFAGFLRRPLDGALAQCDICFVKKNGFLRKQNDWV